MEAAKTLSAQEERRRKLQEYLTGKGKLKLENNKPYLKDSTNLQPARWQQPSKQVREKKDAPPKNTRFNSEANKNRTLNSGLLQSRPTAGKITTQPQILSRKPALPKDNVQRGGPVLSGQAIQRKNGTVKDRSLGKESSLTAHQKAEIGLTVVLIKNQDGDKTRVSDVCLVDKASASEKGDIKSTQTKDSELRTLHKPSVGISAKKSQALPSKPKSACLETNAHKPTGKTIPRHIRIISRVSQHVSNIGTPNERSFVIKSSRTNNLGPVAARMEQAKSAALKPSCAAKPNTAVKTTTTSLATAQKFCPHPVSTNKTKHSSSACTSNKVLPAQNRHTLNKPAVCQKNTRMPGSNRPAPRPQTGGTNRTKGTGSNSVVTNRTNQSATSSNLPCVMASDTPSKPQTPKMTVEDRRRQLEEWLRSKGKTYKRPPMTLPPKQPPTAKKKQNPNLSLWEGIEEEEELLLLSKKIGQTLGECLELIDKGVPSEDIHAVLDKIPERKKFAKYWVCKAKLLEREGITDVVELYKQGVQCGATPIDELREVVFDIMKTTGRKSKVVTFGPLPIEDTAVDSEQYEEKDICSHATPVIKSVDDMETSCFEMGMCDQGSAVKFQVACLSSKKKKDGGSQEWKCLTPVRRSQRIHQSAVQYPEVVQEHDTVVASLDELLDMADTEAYLYLRNEALPTEADHTILSMVKQDNSEGQNEKPA
ncbi:cytoskeleton-associated protein 2-like [Rana temporaria]|uniref:cytoskeleton-associated protein 2-like n=1 Tax=Rana temporaria TaxID=8407 RepID=UPI001AAD37AE|nr:cytoskeleton-associated protein 2-like [Rana temporaria]